jgi:hypothetical protein
MERFKVFISHATVEDGNLVNWMANALDRLHIRAFVYERYPLGGRNRFEHIKTMIRACPYFLVLLTRAGIASQWVNQEIGYAVGAGKTPIPIIEVDNTTGRHIKSSGFVELHDPIDYYRSYEVAMMASVVYTFHGWLASAGQWQGSVFLSCKCGNEFDGEFDFVKSWEIWQQDPERRCLHIEWTCQKCQRKVVLSFPDCYLLTQEG